MKKNDVVTLNITDITDTGSGIGRIDNTVVFVSQTAVGDKVSVIIIKVNKNYCIGKLKEIITPSKNRIIPDCPDFSKCGGCSFRHITYESELNLKQKRAEDCIKRIAKIGISPNPIVSDKNILRYRNKAQYPVGESGEVGFYAPHSHRIIPINDCRLQPEIFNKATDSLKIWMTENNVSSFNGEKGSGLVRHLYLRASAENKQIMVVLVINGKEIPEKQRFISLLKSNLGDSLTSVYLNVNTKNNNVILGKENILLYGKEFITDTVCGISVRLSPNSFYQVNRNMAELLYNKAKEYANPKDKTVLDLYCGTGTIGLTMAYEAKSVIGVEIVEEAVKDAKINAKNNNIKNAEFICGDALKAAEELKSRKLKTDVVILDPPRKGCDSELIKIVANDFCPERVVYVSCDPSTLARDIAIFENEGYKLAEYTPFDLFARTSHVECVALLVKE